MLPYEIDEVFTLGRVQFTMAGYLAYSGHFQHAEHLRIYYGASLEWIAQGTAMGSATKRQEEGEEGDDEPWSEYEAWLREQCGASLDVMVFGPGGVVTRELAGARVPQL